jgi:hypothetical protein
MTDSSRATAPPVLEGPIPGKASTAFAAYDLAPLGYIEEEYFLTGQAVSYEHEGERPTDGRWRVTEKDQADYRTRFVVRRPLDPTAFNGTVIVEWLNVSGGTDAEPDWGLLHRQIVRDGFAWVGVSAQKAGIDGGGIFEGSHIKVLNPERYSSLVHPGDAYAFDMYTQVARFLRADPGRVLGALRPERIVASGHSQSAAFLVTYVNAVDPIARVFEGYFVHGRGAGGAELDSWQPTRRSSRADGVDHDEARAQLTGRGDPIRDDVRVPVLTFQSETDVVELGGGLARQPDGERFRLWEVAGSAHAETYLLMASHQDTGSLSAAELAALLSPSEGIERFPTEEPINTGPQSHYVGHAALAQLDRWVRDGTAPPEAPRLELSPSGEGFEIDGEGNAIGGIRTPWVDVPVATLTGVAQRGGAMMAFLFGRTSPFSAEKLAELYPGGRDGYLTGFSKSLDEAIGKGFLLEVDRPEMLALAEAAYRG